MVKGIQSRWLPACSPAQLSPRRNLLLIQKLLIEVRDTETMQKLRIVQAFVFIE